ncbi:MAG: hypothetical protein LBF87_07500 [Treponema sp.]|nr:hypothetical protein [Treponema sp.]
MTEFARMQRPDRDSAKAAVGTGLSFYAFIPAPCGAVDTKAPMLLTIPKERL